METGSSSEFDKTLIQRNGKRNNKNNDHHVAEKVEPFVPKSEHNPRELRSWAKRTGFVSDYSGEAGTSTSVSEKFDGGVVVGLNRNEQRKNGGGASIDPIVGRMREDGRSEIQLEIGPTRRDIEANHGFNGNGNVNGVVSREGNGNNGHGLSTVAPVPEVKEEEEDVAEGDVKVDVFNEGEGLGGGGGWLRPHGLKCGLRENPGFG